MRLWTIQYWKSFDTWFFYALCFNLLELISSCAQQFSYFLFCNLGAQDATQPLPLWRLTVVWMEFHQQTSFSSNLKEYVRFNDSREREVEWGICRVCASSHLTSSELCPICLISTHSVFALHLPCFLRLQRLFLTDTSSKSSPPGSASSDQKPQCSRLLKGEVIINNVDG